MFDFFAPAPSTTTSIGPINVPVAGIMRLANVMDVDPTFLADNLAEFIAYAKANPGKINFGSGGVGTSPHLSGELLENDGRHGCRCDVGRN